MDEFEYDLLIKEFLDFLDDPLEEQIAEYKIYGHLNSHILKELNQDQKVINRKELKNKMNIIESKLTTFLYED